MTTIRAFFPPKQGTFFQFSKKVMEEPPPPHLLRACLSNIPAVQSERRKAIVFPCLHLLKKFFSENLIFCVG